MDGLSKKLKCSYSRYADDITFSGQKDYLPSLSTLKKIIISEGFILNEKKINYLPASRRQLVTGLVVNERVSVPRYCLREVETHLFFCKKFGVRNHLDFLESKGNMKKSNYKQWLLGKISFVNAIDQKKAQLLFEKFNLIEWDL